jgi:hypothetical protein
MVGKYVRGTYTSTNISTDTGTDTRPNSIR